MHGIEIIEFMAAGINVGIRRDLVSDGEVKRDAAIIAATGHRKEALSKQLHAAPYRRTVVNLALKFSGFDRLVELKSNIFIRYNNLAEGRKSK